MTESAIGLNDCGKEFHLSDGNGLGSMDVTVQMVIKAPRGTMVLFDHSYLSPDSQCEAIRLFMEEHHD